MTKAKIHPHPNGTFKPKNKFVESIKHEEKLIIQESFGRSFEFYREPPLEEMVEQEVEQLKGDNPDNNNQCCIIM
jgi:hypothetical protein